MNGSLLSSKNMGWETPIEFFNKLDEEFSFTLDPCASEGSQRCKKYFTPEIDGLKQSWEGERVFVNPPYGREIKNWVKKCFEERERSEVVVMLIPARTDTTYFHDFIYKKAEIRFLRGRIKFVDPITKKTSDPAPFPSMVVVFRGVKG